MRSVWMEKLGVSEVSVRSGVCSLQFNESDYEVVLIRHILKKDAVPSRNLGKIDDFVLLEEIPPERNVAEASTIKKMVCNKE